MTPSLADERRLTTHLRNFALRGKGVRAEIHAGLRADHQTLGRPPANFKGTKAKPRTTCIAAPTHLAAETKTTISGLHIARVKCRCLPPPRMRSLQARNSNEMMLSPWVCCRGFRMPA